MRCYKSRPAAVLSISGDDHQDFLQGQGTADMRGPLGFCRYTLWLDFKGRILGDAHVLKRSDSEMLLVSDATPAQLLMEKFDRHIIADDVDIEDQTEQFTLTSVEPGSVEDNDTGLPFHGPEAGFYEDSGSAILFHGRRLGQGTLQFLSAEDPLPGKRATELSAVQSEAIRIAAAMPLIPQDSDNQSLNPIEANLISPLCFTKGCYLGQEVVARVERLGRVSRRLALFRAPPHQVDSNCSLNQDGQELGRLTSVVNSDDNCLAIGWLKSRITDGHIAFDEGEFSVQSLPKS